MTLETYTYKMFHLAVVYHPKPTVDANKNDTTPPSKIIVEPRVALFKTETEAAIRASRLIPVEYEEMIDRCEVIVHPF
jgi:hypothetical protein